MCAKRTILHSVSRWDRHILVPAGWGGTRRDLGVVGERETSGVPSGGLRPIHGAAPCRILVYFTKTLISLVRRVDDDMLGFRILFFILIGTNLTPILFRRERVLAI